jgi:hypothetical protein
MLVIGPRCELDAFLGTVGDELSAPVCLVRPSEGIPTAQQGTLVLVDAARLDSHQREVLSTWLGDAGRARPQVLSLSESHLWHRDAPPALPLELYYRLNTICLELQSRSTTPVAT